MTPSNISRQPMPVKPAAASNPSEVSAVAYILPPSVQPEIERTFAPELANEDWKRVLAQRGIDCEAW